MSLNPKIKDLLTENKNSVLKTLKHYEIQYEEFQVGDNSNLPEEFCFQFVIEPGLSVITKGFYSQDKKTKEQIARESQREQESARY